MKKTGTSQLCPWVIHISKEIKQEEIENQLNLIQKGQIIGIVYHNFQCTLPAQNQ